jgi:hypothetical protein
MIMSFDPINRFKEIISGRGLRRYVPEASDPNLLQVQKLERFRSHAVSVIERHRNATTRKMPSIHFDFIDEATVNAIACFDPESGVGFIGFNVGTIFLAYDLFYRMLSHPQIISQLGNSTVETIRDPFHSEGLVRNYDELHSNRPIGTSPCQHNPKR